MIHRHLCRAVFALAFGMLCSAGVHAQVFRSYLSATGNDSHPCTLASPCRTLPVALAAVAAGGEIWILDTGTYNTAPVTLNKSVTVAALPGVLASITQWGTNTSAITVPPIAGIKITLRNLVIAPQLNNSSNLSSGITMAGESLVVQDCEINDLTNYGISVSSNASLTIANSAIRNNRLGISIGDGSRAAITGSIFVGNASAVSAGTVSASDTMLDIIDSTFTNNQNGISVGGSGINLGTVRASLRNSLIAGGFYGLNGTGKARVAVANNTFSNVAGAAVAAQPGAMIVVTGNTITNSGYALYNNGGTLESAGDNVIKYSLTSNTLGVITPASKL